MPIPTPFHPRTSELCTSMFYKDWAGYYAVCSYETTHDAEYYAFRNACGLLDATPLYKYDVKGPDAAAFLSWVTVKNIKKLKLGQVTYLCWCDEAGKVIDDGTVTYMAQDHYRLTAAEPSLSWFTRFSRGFDITIEDITTQYGALALQGPTSKGVLADATDLDMDTLGFFRMKRAKLEGVDVVITRTGYTGDLGYEIWVENASALKVYDALLDHGAKYGLLPAGLDALDVTRVEAGFIMNGVDYHSANHCLTDDRKSTPYELGLGGTVQFKGRNFIGKQALQAEAAAGPNWKTMGLITDWPAYTKICEQYGLPPQVCTHAWRTSVPVYNNAGTQVGYATSGAWSPTLKQNLALVTLKADYARPGDVLQMEVTVEHTRHKCPATVAEPPFFNPERKRS